MNKLTTLILLCWFGFSLAQTPLTNTFTYQGELKSGNALANGSYDFEFSVFDVETNGAVLETVTVTGVTVTNGVFTTPITLTMDLFTGNMIWLDIAVRANGSGNPFEPLSPRQEVTSSPYAIHAQFVGTVGADAVTGVQIQNGSITLSDMHSNSVNSTTIVDNSITSTDIAADAITDLELANNSVDTIAVQDGAINSAKILDGSVGSVDIDSTQVQRRVVSTCPSGEYLIGINQNGSLICQLLPISSEYIIDSLSPMIVINGFILYPSIAINQRNLPVISYIWGNTSASELRIVTCNTPNCSSANAFIKLDNVFFQGDSKVVVPSNNKPVIAYIKSGSLYTIACVTDNCSSVNTPVLIDNQIVPNNVGSYVESLALTIGSNGLPIMSYLSPNGGSARDINVVACLQMDCATFNPPVTLVSNVQPALHTDIIIGSNGMPIVAYHNGNPIVITCTSLDCSSTNPAVTIPNLASIGSMDMALNASGFPILALGYGTNSTTAIAMITCTAIDCSSSTITPQVVDAGGRDLQISLASNGKPTITHYDSATKEVRVIGCYDSTCDNIRSVKTIVNNNAFSETSSAINQKGNPVLVYFDKFLNNSVNNYYLKVFSCVDEYCIK